jgi:hypothetical protein
VVVESKERKEGVKRRTTQGIACIKSVKRRNGGVRRRKDTGTAGAHGRKEAKSPHDLVERVGFVLLALFPFHEPRLRGAGG